jgi:hypothetical protein
MFRSQSDHHQWHHTHICALHFTLSTVYYICIGSFVCTLFHDSRCRTLFITIVGRYVISIHLYDCLHWCLPFNYMCYSCVHYQNVYIYVHWTLSTVLTMFFVLHCCDKRRGVYSDYVSVDGLMSIVVWSVAVYQWSMVSDFFLCCTL